MTQDSSPRTYRGRLAPTPTGDLHVGHARTFHAAYARARDAGGELLLRIEDLDPLRCRTEYVERMLEDLHWLGIRWTGEPTFQSRRRDVYRDVWHRLRDNGTIYPSTVTRKEVRDAAHAPHEEDDEAEPLFPPELRSPPGTEQEYTEPSGVVWRFRVPDGEGIEFDDVRKGRRRYVAGVDFGDFVVWRKDDVPAYELAVVADDIAMGITEVVRGEDLLKSTARQLLIYRALGARPPQWCHEPLVRDAAGKRLAKRADALSIRALRRNGLAPEQLYSDVAGLGIQRC